MTAAVMYKTFSAFVFLKITNGQTTSHMEPFIVGGHDASMALFPHSVYLEANCDDSEWHCGSSIVNQRILLTAAHCAYGCQGYWEMNVFAGHEVIKKMTLVRKISSFVVHSKYDPNNFIHDIALLHMAKHLSFGPNVKRVIIARRFPNDKKLQIAGWGTVVEEPHTKATRLKAVKQTLMTKKACKQAYEDVIYGIRSEGMLCAKYNQQNRPSHGDSGSALMTKDGTQVGLVSFRPQRTPEIIIYTNVTFYLQWIRSNSKRLYCNRG